jgi:hypothetical protein
VSCPLARLPLQVVLLMQLPLLAAAAAAFAAAWKCISSGTPSGPVPAGAPHMSSILATTSDCWRTATTRGLLWQMPSTLMPARPSAQRSPSAKSATSISGDAPCASICATDSSCRSLTAATRQAAGERGQAPAAAQAAAAAPSACMSPTEMASSRLSLVTPAGAGSKEVLASRCRENGVLSPQLEEQGSPCGGTNRWCAQAVLTEALGVQGRESHIL